MTTTVSCACGKSYRLKKVVEPGRSIKCPACSGSMRVQGASAPPPPPSTESDEPSFDAMMSAAAEEASAQTYDASPPPPPPPPPLPSRGAPGRAPGARAGTSYADLAARAPVQKAARQPGVTFEPGWFGSTNSGVVGGILMMAIAVIWFVAGLSFDRIFFYPPILFIIGLIAMLKGMFGG